MIPRWATAHVRMVIEAREAGVDKYIVQKAWAGRHAADAGDRAAWLWRERQEREGG